MRAAVMRDSALVVTDVPDPGPGPDHALDPHDTRIVVAGVCMEHDRIRPMLAINKELSLQFVLATRRTSSPRR